MQNYTVQAKDDDHPDQPETLGQIAFKTHVKKADLFQANRDLLGSSERNLAVGMPLVIPEKLATDASSNDNEGGA